MILPTLYKYTTKGQIQQWTIHVSGDCFWTEEGINTITKSDPTICTGKNIGKKHETTPEQQAILEAKAKWQKKKDKGYNEVLTKEKNFFEPMLAFELKQYKKLMFTVPTFIQPKLDGMRCILQPSGILMSRAGKEIVSCPHIGIYGHLLDGELYNHSLKNDFNKIMSLVRKIKPEMADIQEACDIVQYWIYDNPSIPEVFSKRYNDLAISFNEKKFPDHFKLVPTEQIFTKEDLERKHLEYLELGYEGSIIRMDLGVYENKRSKQLLKYKNFQDAEFEIVDITPGLGNRSEVAGRIICKIGDKTFGCSMTGDLAFMKSVLDNKNQIIGKEATVKFFEYTPDGIPRFPTLKNIIGWSV